MSLFSGLAVATITPFNGGEIDFEAFKRYLLFLKGKGIKSYVINGSTGEPHSLCMRERLKLLEVARNILNDCYIVGGISTTNTRDAIEESEYIASLKIDSLLTITPFCSKCTDEGLFKHYQEIKKHSNLDIIAYNVPSRTGFKLTTAHVERLAKEGIIKGIKQCDPNIENTAFFSLYTDVFIGDDNNIAFLKSICPRGVISVLGNVYPEAIQALLDLPVKEGIALQKSLSPLLTSLYSEINPVLIKYLLSKLNIIKEEFRLPLTEGKIENKQRVYEEAVKVGIPDL